MTKQKQLVLDVALAHHDHPTADQLYLEIRSADSKISRGTVYRNLEQLSSSGELLHVKVSGADRFDSRLDYHYHMFCTCCGAVFDVPLDYQHDADILLAQKTGFHIDRHRTVFEGLCTKCKASQ